jgi:NAD(P)H dehydrogenase (quinone)
VLQGTLAYTGMTVLPPFVAWHVPYISAEARSAMLQDYRQHLERLDEATPLVFPSLDQFDSALRPLA